jgi:tetratricopeptide (TPR) repeat protein
LKVNGRFPALIALLALRLGLLSLSVAQAAESPESLFGANRFAQARTAYEQAIKRDPRQVGLRVGLIRTLFRLDLWQEEATATQQLVQMAPNNGDAHGLRSLSLMRQGDPDGAATEAKRALTLDPNCYWGLVATGRVQVWGDEKQEAKAILRRAVAQHPDWPEAWYGLLEAAADDVNQQDLDDAVAYLRLAPKGHPNTTMVETLPTRMEFMKRFLHDQPYQAIRPIPEAALEAAERGEQPDAVFTTPVERQESYVILPLKIGDQTFHVMFDTGGGFEITLGKKAMGRLSLPLLYKSIVRGVSGSEPARLYKADEMSVGEQTFRSIPVLGIDSETGSFDGIFGVTNFDHYAVTIDFERNQLRLARGKTAAAPAPTPGNRVVSLPFHYIDGDIFVPVTVEGKHVWAVVDTGAEAYAILSLRLAREIAAGLKPGATRELPIKGRMGIGNSVTRQTVLAFLKPLSLTVGEADGQPFQTPINPAYGASPLDEQVSPAGDFEVGALLGIDFLSTAKRVTFDYPHRMLTLEFPPVTAPAPGTASTK